MGYAVQPIPKATGFPVTKFWPASVSYTHLDVYKRQVEYGLLNDARASSCRIRRYIIPDKHASFIRRQGLAMSKSTDLNSMGLKATFPRLKILELFENAEVRHLTADDVYRLLLNENIEIGLATVYRALTQFEQAGLLERHHFESGKAVFEIKAGTHHDHLVCINCGRVEEFFLSLIHI